MACWHTGTPPLRLAAARRRGAVGVASIVQDLGRHEVRTRRGSGKVGGMWPKSLGRWAGRSRGAGKDHVSGGCPENSLSGRVGAIGGRGGGETRAWGGGFHSRVSGGSDEGGPRVPGGAPLASPRVARGGLNAASFILQVLDQMCREMVHPLDDERRAFRLRRGRAGVSRDDGVFPGGAQRWGPVVLWCGL